MAPVDSIEQGEYKYKWRYYKPIECRKAPSGIFCTACTQPTPLPAETVAINTGLLATVLFRNVLHVGTIIATPSPPEEVLGGGVHAVQKIPGSAF